MVHCDEDNVGRGRRKESGRYGGGRGAGRGTGNDSLMARCTHFSWLPWIAPTFSLTDSEAEVWAAMKGTIQPASLWRKQQAGEDWGMEFALLLTLFRLSRLSYDVEEVVPPPDWGRDGA